MKKFVMDLVIEPIRAEAVEMVTFDIEQKFLGWLKKNKIEYKDVYIRMFDTRAILTADMDTTPEWLESNIRFFFKEMKDSDVMSWSKRNISFYRPISNIIAFYGESCLNFELENIKTSDKNLINFKRYIKIDSVNDYYEKMGQYLYATNEECFDKMSSQLKRKAVSIGKKLFLEDQRVYNLGVIDSKLSVVDAEFDQEYLELPEPIIEGVLRSHKNIFCLYYSDGAISNSFLIVYREGTDLNQVKLSTLEMINSELSGISRLFERDLKLKLEDYLPKLNWISKIESVGSIFEKSERIKKIVEKAAEDLSLASEMRENLLKASSIMKADLATRTVKCYKNLKGIVGAEILKVNKEDLGLIEAVREQYLPDFSGKMPKTTSGAILAIADRIDDLAGLEIVGELEVNNSWVLRKTDEIIKLMIAIEPDFTCQSLIENALYAYTENSIGAFDYKKVYARLFRLLKLRFKYVLRRNGINRILIDDTLINGDSVINLLYRKLQELSSVKDENLWVFMKDIISYKKMVDASEIVEDATKPEEARFGDVISYADGKAENTIDFLNILYEYREDFYNLRAIYDGKEITRAGKSLANNLREMWL